MNDNVENIILEQLRAVRTELKSMNDRFGSLESKVDEGFEEVEAGNRALQGMMTGLFGYARSIDERVEHIEKKLGIEE